LGMLHRWIDDPRRDFQEISPASVLSENIAFFVEEQNFCFYR
jgi:hypothetical protein